MFCVSSRTNFAIWITFNISSANALNPLTGLKLKFCCLKKVQHKLLPFAGSFLGLRTGRSDESVAMETDNVYADDQVDPQEESQNFKQMLSNVGAHGVYDE